MPLLMEIPRTKPSNRLERYFKKTKKSQSPHPLELPPLVRPLELDDEPRLEEREILELPPLVRPPELAEEPHLEEPPLVRPPELAKEPESKRPSTPRSGRRTRKSHKKTLSPLIEDRLPLDDLKSQTRFPSSSNITKKALPKIPSGKKDGGLFRKKSRRSGRSTRRRRR
jgi:hypothetical protein